MTGDGQRRIGLLIALTVGAPMLDKFKDECGVFGIFGHPEAANLTYLGLYALQHRGQESAGIVAADGARIRASRAMGQVAEAFDEATLEKLPGHLAIGHTRYSTAGESKLENAQPFLIDCAHGQIAVAHNGNLVNARELRDELVRDGSIFQTGSDTEVILHLYARSKAPTVEDAIIESIAQVRGAYSLALLTANRLIAARDPNGFRPLALGRMGDAWIVCSETCALDLIGATYERDIEPGEVVVITEAGVRSIKPFPPQPLSHCVFEHVYFARPDSYVFGSSVNEVRTEFGRTLALEAPVDADVVVPIPDSGVCAAIGFAEQAGLPMKMGLIRNHYVGRTFIEPQQAIRHFSVKVKLNPVRSILEGRRVDPVGRLDCPRYDEPEDREDGQGGRRARGAPAHQLSADHLTLLLRCGHAEPVRVDCCDSHDRGHQKVHRGGQPRISQPRWAEARRPAEAEFLLHVLLHGCLSARVSTRRAGVPPARVEGGRLTS